MLQFEFEDVERITALCTSSHFLSRLVCAWSLELNYTALRDYCGIKAVVFDKDNTLTAPYDLTPHPKAATGLQNALDTFGASKVAILSNSAGTGDDPNFEDARQIEDSLGISVVRHAEKKPGGLDELMEHFGDEIQDPSEICMVGDRLLTDIVFGNLYGMLTVHCLPLCEGEENAKDNKIANVLRKGENKFMFTDWTGSRMVRSRTIPHSKWKGEDICPLIILPEIAVDNKGDKTLEEDTTIR
jgi:phosphatidylglycerophosphatase GEP4